METLHQSSILGKSLEANQIKDRNGTRPGFDEGGDHDAAVVNSKLSANGRVQEVDVDRGDDPVETGDVGKPELIVS